MRQINKRIESQKTLGLTIMMALRWLIKSRGHSFIWSSHLCESHTCGHTGSNFLPYKPTANDQWHLKGGEKVLIWASFFSFSDICACILMSTFTQCILQTLKTKRGEIKTHSKKGSNSLNWNVLQRSEKPSIQGLQWSHRVGCLCRDTPGLRQVFGVIKVGLFGTRKTYENLFSSFFFTVFCMTII